MKTTEREIKALKERNIKMTTLLNRQIIPQINRLNSEVSEMQDVLAKYFYRAYWGFLIVGITLFVILLLQLL